MEHPRIERDREIMNGKPVIKGTRMPVEIILERLADGRTVADLLDDYPFLTTQDIYAALEFAASLVHAEATRPTRKQSRLRRWFGPTVSSYAIISPLSTLIG